MCGFRVTACRAAIKITEQGEIWSRQQQVSKTSSHRWWCNSCWCSIWIRCWIQWLAQWCWWTRWWWCSSRTSNRHDRARACCHPGSRVSQLHYMWWQNFYHPFSCSILHPDLKFSFGIIFLTFYPCWVTFWPPHPLNRSVLMHWTQRDKPQLLAMSGFWKHQEKP